MKTKTPDTSLTLIAQEPSDIFRRSMPHPIICGISAFALTFWQVLPVVVLANPSGEQVAVGSASFDRAGSTLTINQGSDKAIINWQDFSIAAGETTRFIQPSSSSLALNRVIGQDVSSIYGNLEANGGLYLINPNGIVIGESGVISAQSFIASTHDVADADFLDGGGLNFFDSGASDSSIVNLGSISANGGDVYLISENLTNQGSIFATGRAGLVSSDGADVYLSTSDADAILVSAGANNGNSIVNEGTIEAAQVELRNNGGNVYALAINNSGIVRATGASNVNGRVILNSGAGTIYNSGIVEASNIDSTGGEIDIVVDAGNFGNDGTLDASGTEGGSITVEAERVSNSETITVEGSNLAGGEVVIKYETAYMDTRSSEIDASGMTDGGSVRILTEDADSRLYSSSSISADGLLGKGGEIKITGAELYAMGVNYSADGATGGGEISVGGGYQGGDLEIMNATDVEVSPLSVFSADALLDGDGGQVVIWSDGETDFLGGLSATGGALSGDGGLLEVSGKDRLYFAGTADASAPFGANGTLLLDPKNLTIDSPETAASTYLFEFIDPNKNAGNQFGGQVIVLPNGNVVISSVYDDFGGSDAGAVYMFNGSTGALMSALRGSRSTDMVGSGGLMLLNNGNFTVASPNWTHARYRYLYGVGTRFTTADNAGAVTWGSLATGVNGIVSSSNSTVGDRYNDKVGSGGVVALTDGNFVISSPDWGYNYTFRGRPYSRLNVGAVTVVNGNAATGQILSRSNTIYGSENNHVSSGGVYASTRPGSYFVISSPLWDNGGIMDAGVVTTTLGTVGMSGLVTSFRSIYGASANDQVGSGGVVFLANPNHYVVISPEFNGNMGAVTWQSVLGSPSGSVDSVPSFLGLVSGHSVGSGGVTALTNGGYVVSSPLWDNGSLNDVGAVTLISNGNGPVSGTISTSNSIYGLRPDDRVGSGGVSALANGNYIVSSPLWDNVLYGVTDAGAVSVLSGTAVTGRADLWNLGLAGVKAGDQIGSGGVTVLANNHFIVSSPMFSFGGVTNRGAVTFRVNGAPGEVAGFNSLLGASSNDQIGSGGITLLNGNSYVVSSPLFDSGGLLDTGAVTWMSPGLVSNVTVNSSNSLVGGSNDARIGNAGVVPLSNSNYVVMSSFWGGGAVTLRTRGSYPDVVDFQNSLTGESLNSGLTHVVENASTGSYITSFRYSNYNGSGGRVFSSSSVPTNSYLFESDASKSITVSASSLKAVLDVGTDLVLQANNDITINEAISVANGTGDGGDLTFQAGRSILINNSITTDNGNLNLYANDTTANGVIDAHRDAGAAVITQTAGTINAGNGIVTLEIRDGAGKTNTDSGDITLNNITASKISAINNGPTSGSGIFLNGTLTASGADDAITLVGDQLVNNTGASALSASSGRWLVFLNQVTGNTFGDLDSSNQALWNTSYGATITPTGNRYVFAQQPTITFTTTSDSKTYGVDFTGATDIGDNFTAAGFIDASAHGNVFTQDTVANTLTGSAVASSTGAINTASVNSGTPYATTIDITGVTATTGYALAKSETGTLTVTPAAATVTANSLSKVYGTDITDDDYNENSTAGDEFTVSGLLFSDSVTSVSLASAGEAANADVNTYTITPSAAVGTGVGNYNITFNTGTLTVTAKPLTITGVSANNKIYDGNDTAILTAGSLVGTEIVGSDVVNLVQGSGTFAQSDVGTGITVTATGFTLGGTSAGNYSITQPTSLSADITAKGLTITGVSANNKIYDGNDTAILTAGSLVGSEIVGSDVVNLVQGSGTFAQTDVGTGITVTATGFSLGGTSAGNYSITQPTGLSADITAKGLTITGVSANNKIYDGNDTATLSSGSLVGSEIVGSDVLSLVQGTGTFADPNVANNIAVTASGFGLTGANAGNYSIAAQPTGLSADITERPLTYQVTDSQKTVGQINPVFDGVWSGFASGEDETILTGTLSFLTAAITNSPAGSYAVSASGPSGSNYTITFLDGTLTVLSEAVNETSSGASQDTSLLFLSDQEVLGELLDYLEDEQLDEFNFRLQEISPTFEEFQTLEEAQNWLVHVSSSQVTQE